MTVKNIGLDKLKLLDIPLFSGLDRTHLAKLVPVLEEVNYQAGEVLFQQGEFGDSLYIIVRGTVKIFINLGDETKELARLGERECFGEMSLLTGDPRSAGVQAVTELTVLRLSKDRFDELLMEHNSLAVQFAGILARRLNKIQSKSAGSKDTPVKVPSKPKSENKKMKAERKTDLVSLMKEKNVLPVTIKEYVKKRKLGVAFLGAFICFLLICLLAVTIFIPFWQGKGLISQSSAGSGLSLGHTSRGDIKIGVAGSFTDSEGALYKHGIEMAINEINTGGGILGSKIQAVYKDDQGDITMGLANAQSFAEKKEAVAVIGHSHPYISAPAAVFYDKAGIVMLSPAAFVPQTSAKGYNYIFQNMPAPEEFGRSAATYAAEQGCKRTVIYYADNQYGRSLANAFENQAGALGIEIIDRLSDFGGLKSEDVLPKWQVMGFDSLFLVESQPEGTSFIVEARKAGIKVPIYASSDLDSSELLQAGDEALAGTTVFSVFDPLDPRPEVKNFINSYQSRYGVKPDMLAAQGYDSVKMLAEAIKLAGSTNSDQIAGKLRDMNQWPGVTGSHSFDQNGNVVDKSIVIRKMWEEK